MNEWVHYVEKVYLGLNQEHEYIQDIYVKKHLDVEVARVMVRDYNPNKVYASTKDCFKTFDNLNDAILWVNGILSGTTSESKK